MTPQERLDDMLDRYGEVCKRTVAAKILGCSTCHIKTMIDDGRLRLACGGEKVDVRSIAEYITQPAQADENARIERLKARYNTNWAV